MNDGHHDDDGQAVFVNVAGAHPFGIGEEDEGGLGGGGQDEGYSADDGVEAGHLDGVDAQGGGNRHGHADHEYGNDLVDHEVGADDRGDSGQDDEDEGGLADEKRGQNVLEEGADTGFFMADESGEGEDIGDDHHQFPVHAFLGVLDEGAGGFAVDVEQLQDGKDKEQLAAQAKLLA